MKTQALADAIRHIETLARRDPGGRGLTSAAGKGHLLASATELLRGERFILVTGFCIRSALIGETDGPSGTLALADALRRLGKDVVLVSDAYSADLLQAGAHVLGEPFPLLSLSLPQAEADREILALLASFAPTHVVAIERPGSATDGHRYSMRGEILDDLVPAADAFLQPPLPRTYRTVAIGDGGNELGMGSLRSELQGRVMHGDLIFCATEADFAIPAGISNWGAYALVAALSLLAGRWLLRPPQDERAILETMVAVGAVDGCTKKNEVSVDGLPWDDYARTLIDINTAFARAEEIISPLQAV